MAALRFFLVFAFLAFPFSVFAQTDDEVVKEKLRRESALLEQILADAKNLRLAENRAFVSAKVAAVLWQTDEKRARRLFQNAISDLSTAQNEAESEKSDNGNLHNLIYGQSPRWEILTWIASRDAEFALDAMAKTRPAKIARAILNFTGDNQSQIQHYARSEIQNEQRLIAQAAEQNPERAVKLLRESLKKDVSHETVNLLKKIFQKDAETANQLADEVAQKLLDTKFNEDNRDTGFLQYFLGEFGQEKTAEIASIKVSEQLLRALADKIVKFVLRPNINSSYLNPAAMKVVEKYSPASVAQIKQKQTRTENQNPQNENFNKLMQNDVSSDELLAQADKFPRSYRAQIYRRAAEKAAQGGDVAQAQKIISSNLSEEESERYLSQFNYNLATQAIGQGKYDEANQIINQITDEKSQLNALIYLATSIHGKDPKENQTWAATTLNQARGLISDAPEKSRDIDSLLSVAAAYAQIEPAQSFQLIESLVAPLNELTEASAVVAKYSDNGNFRLGEYRISGGNNFQGAYNLGNVLKTLKNKDFDRTIVFVRGFSRLDFRLGLELQLLDAQQTNDSLGRGFIFSSGSKRGYR